MRALIALVRDICLQGAKARRKEELLFLANLLLVAGNPAGHEFLKKALTIK